MTTTTYYNLNIVEGTDIVNPLTVDNPNYETIDEVMHSNAVSGVTLATEIANATVHAITRENSECAVIRFIATSEWKAGDTATVDGVPVTALLPSGETLPNGAYVINANVLCILTGTNLTVYAERKKVDNASEIAYNETTVAAALTVLNSDLAVKHGTLTPANASLHLVKSGKVCTFSGIYTVGDNLGVGTFGMTSLSFAPIFNTDISIVVASSPSNSVAGGYIDTNGNVFYQVNEPITANTQLRVCGTFITN